MAAEFMEGFYAPANARNALMRRNKQRFSPLAARFSEFSSNNPVASMLPSAYKLRLFQMFWGIDKIPRRDANRATNVCLVSLTTRNFGVSLHEETCHCRFDRGPRADDCLRQEGRRSHR